MVENWGLPSLWMRVSKHNLLWCWKWISRSSSISKWKQSSKKHFEAPWGYCSICLVHKLCPSTNNGLYTLTYSRFQGHIASGRTVSRAQVPTVRCTFHPWKMAAFIFFFKLALEYLSWCGSGASLVSRDFVSESSDLISHRQFPVSLRCSLAEYYGEK